MAGEIVTGLLYYDDGLEEMHDLNNIVDRPLGSVPYEKLCPGQSALKKLQDNFR